MSRWPITDVLNTLRRPLPAARGSVAWLLGSTLGLAIAQAMAATVDASASATMVAAGRVVELLGQTAAAVQTSSGAASIVLVLASSPLAAPAGAAASATTIAHGTLRGDFVVTVSAVAAPGLAPAPGSKEIVYVTVAFN